MFPVIFTAENRTIHFFFFFAKNEIFEKKENIEIEVFELIFEEKKRISGMWGSWLAVFVFCYIERKWKMSLGMRFCILYFGISAICYMHKNKSSKEISFCMLCATKLKDHSWTQYLKVLSPVDHLWGRGSKRLKMI